MSRNKQPVQACINFIYSYKGIKNIAGIMIILAAGIILPACKTYHIPLESFREQFQGIDYSAFVYKRVRSGYMVSGAEWTEFVNPIRKIKCLDKRDHPIALHNSPTIEMRVTDNHQLRLIFYFAHVFVRNDTLFGNAQHGGLGKAMWRQIPLKDIIKIEIQDDKKAFFYD